MGHAIILSAPASGAGKTTLTLGLLRALYRRGVAVAGAKSGPDYIDPRFHQAACQRPCPNLDGWAMKPERIKALAAGAEAELLLVEGAMGLFDGAPPDGQGATADLARILRLPVVLIIDAARMAQSVAPLLAGFARFRDDVTVGGVILNNVGSPRHAAMLKRALVPLGIPVLGVMQRQAGLAHPSRHLGLMQASEHPDLPAYLDRVADAVEAAIDLDTLTTLARPLPDAPTFPAPPPPAQRIAIAQDHAFAFAYPHHLADWRAAGASLQFFSPLRGQPAPKDAELIFLPGGYPELYAGQLAAAAQFKASMQDAARRGVQIYGECGGYMVLGETMVDAKGHSHQMLGLLDVQTSFANPQLHLGYRQVVSTDGPFAGTYRAHEFHYARTISAQGEPLFHARDAEGNDLGPMGLVRGSVCGSFIHLLDKQSQQ
ncbi:MAG: cobyrinic acid a,c-diamide synthase [Rhodobacterales bacterium]|nr:MAG: cobyrinic acid a,c-diamide synthase [Rhodobacterales bacterium]